jgi:hypothetical protein
MATLADEVTDELIRRMVTLANNNQSRITEDFNTVRRLVDSADVVFAVWQDQSERLGVGWRIVKGKNLLAQISQDGFSRKGQFQAIPCIDGDQAAALEMVAGDKPN